MKKDKSDSRQITLDIEGQSRRVLRSDYVTAKTKQLRKFGYPSLTEQEVSDELDCLANNKPITVIGHFMKYEIVIQNP